MVKLLVHSSGRIVRSAIKVNAMNNESLTALDLVMHLPIDEADQERIRSSLCSVRAKRGQDIFNMGKSKAVATKLSCAVKWVVSKSKIKSLQKNFMRLKVERDTPLDTRNALLVVVVLIVTATYQTGLNPPGGYWQDDNTSSEGGCIVIEHLAGQPIWYTKARLIYNLVMLFNFAGFLLSIIDPGLQPHSRISFTWCTPTSSTLYVAYFFMVNNNRS
ncbi:ankyrin repeat-containing protein At2g01680-like [Macadamia integrifolia]|uniref:ankyrin repeat-containing protein At2g01680-like n=1 Tax=Macadamia integrifolia TaxID=60698 RepID=UPI001C50064F|nr:ankyrin repeat-containing protein At2g01680-like [Macadamia integrifolia]